LGRGDIFGKTGTTNDAIDAWFAGFHPSLAAVVWIGYDNPRSLGSTGAETGGGLSLPIWISYMQHALQGVPVATLEPPEGLTRANGDWAYNEFAGTGIRNLGLNGKSNADSSEPNGTQALPAEDEKKSILDLFKN
jgi:penicillin-binding protein 1A